MVCQACPGDRDFAKNIFAGECDDVTRMLSATDLFVRPPRKRPCGWLSWRPLPQHARVAADCPVLNTVNLNGVRRILPTCPRHANPCSRKEVWVPTSRCPEASRAPRYTGRPPPRWMASTRPYPPHMAADQGHVPLAVLFSRKRCALSLAKEAAPR